MIEHANGIYEIKNFLTEKEINIFMSSVTNDGFVQSHPGNIVKDLNKDSLDCIPNISNRIMSYFKNANSHTKINKIRRLNPGEFMAAHIDEGYPDSKEKIVFGVVVYINDDFNGGELFYTDLDIKIKPVKASIVIHNAQFKHEVLPVIDGSRYSLTTFIFGNELTIFQKKNNDSF